MNLQQYLTESEVEEFHNMCERFNLDPVKKLELAEFILKVASGNYAEGRSSDMRF